MLIVQCFLLIEQIDNINLLVRYYLANKYQICIGTGHFHDQLIV